EFRKEVRKMQWGFIVALVIAIPIVLLPAAFVWYLNVGGIYVAIKEVREKRATRNQVEKMVTEENQVTVHAGAK
ncbi:hypothetical protein ACFLYR_08555, partial [Chloroflexota bacterium]